MKTYRIKYYADKETYANEYAYENAYNIFNALARFISEHGGCEVVSIELD